MITSHQAGALFDLIFTAVYFVTPIWLVARFYYHGVAIGTVFIWFIQCLIFPANAAFRPGGLWPCIYLHIVCEGWFIGFLYSGSIFAVIALIKALFRYLRKKSPVSVELPSPAPTSLLFSLVHTLRQLHPLERIYALLVISYLIVLTLMAVGVLSIHS